MQAHQKLFSRNPTEVLDITPTRKSFETIEVTKKRRKQLTLTSV
jgi:hypothetical protein